jgi:hypothetical protein
MLSSSTYWIRKSSLPKQSKGCTSSNPSSTNLKASAQFLNTVDKNKTFFTQQQIEKARRARELYHGLGMPSTADFKAIICMNLITNNPITQEDIDIVEQIFELNIRSLKGKTTRKTPPLVVNNYIKIPQNSTQSKIRSSSALMELRSMDSPS